MKIISKISKAAKGLVLGGLIFLPIQGAIAQKATPDSSEMVIKVQNATGNSLKAYLTNDACDGTTTISFPGITIVLNNLCSETEIANLQNVELPYDLGYLPDLTILGTAGDKQVYVDCPDTRMEVTYYDTGITGNPPDQTILCFIIGP